MVVQQVSGFSRHCQWWTHSHWHDSELPVPIFTLLSSHSKYEVTISLNCNATRWFISASAGQQNDGSECGRYYKTQIPSSNLLCSCRNWTIIIMKLKILTLVLLLRAVIASPYFDNRDETGQPGIEKGSPEFWYHLIVSVFLVLAGGVFAGWVYRKDKFEFFSADTLPDWHWA